MKTAALAFGLQFQFLARERYDLVIPEAGWQCDGVQAMVQWLSSDAGQRTIRSLGGYDTSETGSLRWVT